MPISLKHISWIEKFSKVPFGYLDLDLDFKSIDLKCLNFKFFDFKISCLGTERRGGFPKFLAIQVIWNLWIWAFEIQDGFGPNPNSNSFKPSKQRIWILALKSKSLGPNPLHPNRPEIPSLPLSSVSNKDFKVGYATHI